MTFLAAQSLRPYLLFIFGTFDSFLAILFRKHTTCSYYLSAYSSNIYAVPPGFTGKRCETNIDKSRISLSLDKCINNPCGINGECTDDINGFKCQCNSGFFGQTCNITCPYHVVEDRCYYFREDYTYDTQKKFCKTLFSGNGRLFEPQDLATFNKVYNVAKNSLDSDLDLDWWMGIRDPFKNGTLAFESNGLPLPFTIPTDGVNHDTEDCVLIKTPGKWISFYCSAYQNAICENSSEN